MNKKLITLAVSVGLVVFGMLFFRTGNPDIPGLERPSIKLASFRNPDTKKAPEAAQSSKFKTGEKKLNKPKTTRQRTPNNVKNRFKPRNKDVKAATGKRVGGLRSNNATGGKKLNKSNYMRNRNRMLKNAREKSPTGAHLNEEEPIYEEDALIEEEEPLGEMIPPDEMGMDEEGMDDGQLPMVEEEAIIQ